MKETTLSRLLNWALLFGGLSFIFLPALAGAQTMDPTTAVTAMETWITGPFARIAISLFLAITGLLCCIGHHPFLGIAAVCLGAFLIFGSQWAVTQFFGG